MNSNLQKEQIRSNVATPLQHTETVTRRSFRKKPAISYAVGWMLLWTLTWALGEFPGISGRAIVKKSRLQNVSLYLHFTNGVGCQGSAFCLERLLATRGRKYGETTPTFKMNALSGKKNNPSDIIIVNYLDVGCFWLFTLIVMYSPKTVSFNVSAFQNSGFVCLM